MYDFAVLLYAPPVAIGFNNKDMLLAAMKFSLLVLLVPLIAFQNDVGASFYAVPSSSAGRSGGTRFAVFSLAGPPQVSNKKRGRATTTLPATISTSQLGLFPRRSSNSAPPADPILSSTYSTRIQHCGSHRLASTSISADDADGESCQSRMDDRNSELTKQYELLTKIFGATGLVLLLMPDRTMTTLLASKCGGAAGYLLAGGLSHILAGANDHDRLTSDTYKRLNVGLLGFCLIGSFALPGEASFLPRLFPAVLIAGLTTSVKVFGAVVSYVGWRRGVESEVGGAEPVFAPKKMLGSLYKGTKETAKGMRVQNKKKALTYRNCVLLVGMGIVSAFMEGLFNIRVSKSLTFQRLPGTGSKEFLKLCSHKKFCVFSTLSISTELGSKSVFKHLPSVVYL